MLVDGAQPGIGAHVVPAIPADNDRMRILQRAGASPHTGVVLYVLTGRACSASNGWVVRSTIEGVRQCVAVEADPTLRGVAMRVLVTREAPATRIIAQGA